MSAAANGRRAQFRIMNYEFRKEIVSALEISFALLMGRPGGAGFMPARASKCRRRCDRAEFEMQAAFRISKGGFQAARTG